MRHWHVLSVAAALVIVAGTAGVLAVSRLAATEDPLVNCAPLDPAPDFELALPGGDCVTAWGGVEGHEGEYRIGTEKGFLGLIVDGDLAETSAVPNNDGPVSGLFTGSTAVTFVVDKGIGVFSVARSEFVRFDAQDEFVRDEYFVRPDQTWELTNDQNRYVFANEDGGEQRFVFQGGSLGQLCLSVLRSKGAIPDEPWCLPPGALFDYVEPTLAPLSPSTCVTLPVAGLDSDAPIRELILSDSKEQERRVEIEAGKDYRLRLRSSKRGMLWMWRLEPFGGTSFCPVMVSGDTESIDIAINISLKGEYEFYDPVRPHIRGVIVVK
jgi:hypothetical protein